MAQSLLDLSSLSRLLDLRENAAFNKHHKCHQTMLWTSVKLQSEERPSSTEDISLLCFTGRFCLVLWDFGVF